MGLQFRMTKVPLETVRPFLYGHAALSSVDGLESDDVKVVGPPLHRHTHTHYPNRLSGALRSRHQPWDASQESVTLLVRHEANTVPPARLPPPLSLRVETLRG